MELTEAYYILTKKGIYFTVGKKINKDYAICRTKDGRYTITHIETGARVGMEYETAGAAFEASRWVIGDAEKRKKENKELYERNVKAYKKMFEQFMKQNKIIED